MNTKITYPQLYQMFGAYFHQDYELMIDSFNDSEPVIPQLVQSYKEGRSQRKIDEAINELKSLISKHYTSNILEDILTELGNNIDNEYYGYTNQQFLIEVLKILKE